MNKIKILSTLVVGLFVANLFLIWFIVSRTPPAGGGGDRPKKAVIEKLHFDEKQVASYEKLIEWHRSELKKLEAELLSLRNDFYATLTQTQNSSLSSKDSLAKAIGEMQIRIENTHYKHFQDIQNLCKPEQQAFFETLALEITNIFPKTKNPKK
jgi:protein CpxP